MLSLVKKMPRKFSSSLENLAYLVYLTLVASNDSILLYIALGDSCLKKKKK